MQGSVLAESTDIFEGCVILLGALGLRNFGIRPDEVVVLSGRCCWVISGVKGFVGVFLGFVFESCETIALVILCH